MSVFGLPFAQPAGLLGELSVPWPGAVVTNVRSHESTSVPVSVITLAVLTVVEALVAWATAGSLTGLIVIEAVAGLESTVPSLTL